jgi:hypothetical protein
MTPRAEFVPDAANVLGAPAASGRRVPAPVR